MKKRVKSTKSTQRIVPIEIWQLVVLKNNTQVIGYMPKHEIVFTKFIVTIFCLVF